MSGVDAAMPLIQDKNKIILQNAGLVGEAPKSYPRGLEADNLPQVYAVPGESTITGTEELKLDEATFALITFVDAVSQGVFDDPIKLSLDLRDALVTGWMDTINETNEDNILDYGGQIEDDGTLTVLSGYRIEVDHSRPIQVSEIKTDMKWVDPDLNYFGFNLSLPILIRSGSKLL